MTTGKKLIFAGSGPGSPWATLGHVTGRVLAKHGYEVEVVRKPGPQNPPAVGGGEADLGVITLRIAMDAMTGAGQRDGKSWPNLRRIATVDRPSWFAVAVARTTGITSIEQIAEKKPALRIFGRKDRLTKRLFELYGFSFEDIDAWGGKFYSQTAPFEEILMGGRDPDGKHPNELARGGFLDMIAASCNTSMGEAGTFWRQATTFMDLHFLSLSDEVIATLGEEFGHDRETISALTFDGVDEDVATIGDYSLCVYCHEGTDDDLVYLIAKSYDEDSREFIRTRHQFSYNPRHSAADNGFPLHAAAERYYKEKMYL